MFNHAFVTWQTTKPLLRISSRCLVVVSLFIGHFAGGAENRGLINSPPAGYVDLTTAANLSTWYGRPERNPPKDGPASNEQLQAWVVETVQHWKLDSSEFVNDGTGPYLTTEADYGDFDLLLQCKIVSGADTGIYLRGVPQVQMWDPSHPRSADKGAALGSGGLWNNAPGAKGKDPLVKADAPLGEWNQFRIRLLGERCWVWLNDKLVVDDAPLANYFDRSSPLPKSGPIQLQTHNEEVRWRHIFLKPLSADEADSILISADLSSAELLFDGRKFSDWRGATESYEAVLRCKSGFGGTLYSKNEYADFNLFVEFRLPPGGNNGLVLRYPSDSNGEVDGAYGSMCELQILDNDDPRYTKLDPRQYHGSAYGMAAARRGYLRETGQWNYEKVTVRGSTIHVELNGTQILAADLDMVDAYLDNKSHPGKTRRTGAVGLAGHNDAVEFRLIAVQPLIEK